MSEFDQEIFEAKKDLFFEVLERIQAEGAKETTPKLFGEAIELTSKLWDFLAGNYVTVKIGVDATEAIAEVARAEKEIADIKLPLSDKKTADSESPLNGLTGRQQAVIDDINMRIAAGQSTTVAPMVDTLKMTPKEIRAELTILKALGLVKEQPNGSWWTI